MVPKTLLPDLEADRLFCMAAETFCSAGNSLSSVYPTPDADLCILQVHLRNCLFFFWHSVTLQLETVLSSPKSYEGV